MDTDCQYITYTTSANSKGKEMCHIVARNSIGLNRSPEQLTIWFQRFFYFLFMSQRQQVTDSDPDTCWQRLYSCILYF